MRNKVYGSGGGKSGGGGSPKESPDSLQSRQKARMVEVVSEGAIVGLVDGLKSVYLNDVPIQAANGDYNFDGVTLVSTTGTPLQDYIPGFSEQESEHQLNAALTHTTPQIFSIGDRASSGADAVRVTVSVPGLTAVSDSGDITGTSVTLRIEVQHAGGGFVPKIVDTISGKTNSKYQRAYRIQLPQDQAGPWDVRVIRDTPDSTSAKLTNSTMLDSYTVISETKMRYTNSAVVGIEINAEQFSSIPVRGYHCKGLRIKVPAAPYYDPVTRLYSGIWNGAFETKYSNNPAWVLYDLLTSDRYGLGSYIDPSLIDIWTLYTIAKYCDELVPDGYGGMEPRYTCNLYIQERSEAFTLIANIASIAHMATYGSGGGIAFVQDAPRDPIALFSPANVIDGKFDYSGASIKAQHNVVLVSWNDPADMYRQKIEYVEDAGLIAKYGIVQTEVVAMGCTSRGQARRFGKAILYAEQYESEGIAFSASFDTYKVYPGATFNVADPTRSQVRNGGRLLSATDSSIEVDGPVDIPVGMSHTLKVVLPDGTVEARDVVSSGNGLTTLAVTPAFSQVPVKLAMWVLEATNKLVESWVCLSVKENHDTGNIDVVGMAYHPDKFNLIDSGEALPPTPQYNPYLSSIPPANLTATAYLSPTGVGLDLVISWVPAEGSKLAKVTWRHGYDNFESMPAYGNTYTLRGVSVGDYTIQVSTTNGIGIESPPAQLVYSVTSVSVLPDITGLVLQQPFVDKFASFKWDALPTADSYTVQVLSGGLVKREIVTTDNWYTYDYAESVADGGGTPFRSFTLRVKGRFGTLTSANWALGPAINSAPATPAVSVVAITGGFQVSAPMPPDTDYAGMVVWASTTTGFTPSNANKVYDGTNNSANIIGMTAGIPVYVRAAFYDVYGKTSLNVSPEYSVQPLSNVADIPVVGALPTSGMTEGQVVYLLTDKKLYRYSTDGLGGTTLAWRTWVDGSDILAASVTAGKINVTELSALSANLGTMTAGNITLDQFGFVRGGQSGYRTGNGFWFGYDGATYKSSFKGSSGVEFVFDGTGISIFDALGHTILSASGVPYTSVTGTPTSLADVNSTEATKLAGITAGATRNAYLGAYSAITQYQYGDVVTKDGSAWNYIGGTPTTGNAPPTLPVVSNTYWGLYASQGPTGQAGVNGTRTAILEMYISSATVPTVFPSGSSTYTWATGQFTAPGTPNGWALTPPTPGAGEQLYITRQLYSDQSTSTTSSVTWAATIARLAGGANGLDGAAGANGSRTAFLELYLWSAATPTTFPSGNSTYTWADGSFTAPATPNGWALTPGAAVPGQTLWACSVRFADQGSTTTSSIPWGTTVAYAIGAAGTDGVNAKLAVLTASSQVFQVSKLGVTTPSAITLTAYGQNVIGSPVFSVVSGTATLTGAGNTRSLSDVGLTTDTATLKITWDGQEDFITIAKVREGVDGAQGAQGTAGAAGTNSLTVVLSNEAHTLPSANDGTVQSYANSGTTVQVYEGATLLTAGGTANGSFTVGAPVQAPVGTLVTGAVTYAGNTATVAAHSGMALAVDTVALTFPITVKRADGSTSVVNRAQTLTKSKAGAAGADGAAGAAAITVVVSNESHNLPATSGGVVSDYSNSGTTIQVYEGASLLLAGGAANGSFTVGTITQAPLATLTPGNVTYSGNTATVLDHSAMVTGTDAVALTLPITIKRLDGTVVSASKVQTLVKSKQGSTGTAGATGATGSVGPTVSLAPNRPATFTATDGALDSGQSDIIFNAAVTGIAAPSYAWSFSGFQAAPVDSGTSVMTITAAQFGSSKSATVTCVVNGTYKDVTTIARLEKSTAAAGADKTSTAMQAGVAISAGGITLSGGASLIMNGGGDIRGGQTDYATGIGFFLGYSVDNYKFSIGDPAGDNMTWDGHTLAFHGSIKNTKPYIAGSLPIAYDGGAVKSVQGTTSPTKVREAIIDRGGSVYVLFQMLGLQGTAYGMVYVNGAPAGALKSTSSFSFTGYSDLINVSANDRVQLFIWTSGGSAITQVVGFTIAVTELSQTVLLM